MGLNTAVLSKKRRQQEASKNGVLYLSPVTGKPLSDQSYGGLVNPEQVQADAAKLGYTAKDKIAAGQSNNPMNLPESEIKKMSALGVTSPGVTNFVVSDDDEDYEDTSGFLYNDENIFAFTGEKNKGKKPNADLKKLPSAKQKKVTPAIPVIIDKEGDAYQSLGQWNGDLSFLDEVVKNMAPPPKGSFLYRRPTGVSLADMVQMDYYIGQNPELSNFGSLSFKKIGSRMISEVSNLVGGSVGGFGFGNSYAPIGQTMMFTPKAGNSFASNYTPISNGFGSFSLSTAKPTGLGAFYNPLLLGNPMGYTTSAKPVNKEATEESGSKGQGFANIANGIANIATAGAAVINAIKTPKTQTPVGVSNGDMSAYLAAQNAGSGGGLFGGGGGFFGSDPTAGYSYDDEGNVVYSGAGSGSGITEPQKNNGSSKTLLYVVGGLILAGLAYYFIKNRKK